MNISETAAAQIVKWRVALFVVVPTMCALAYFLFLAAPTYQSETRLIVRESKETAPAFPGLGGGLLGGIGTASLEDAYILAEYLHSSELIDAIDAALDLRSHFSAPRPDFVRRLKPNAPSEDLHRFFRRMTRLTVLTDSGIVSLQVRAFSPEFAQKLANEMIARSEIAINDLNTRLTEATLQTAERELLRARDQLADVRRRLFDFQVENRIVDPGSEIQLQLSNLAAIDARLLEREARLAVRSQILRDDAFELQVLRREIAALREQRSSETGRMVSPAPGSAATAAHQFEALKLDAELALQQYSAALTSSETRKLDASRQQKFLLAIGAPALPEEPAFPRPIRATATAFLIILLFYGIGRLVIATIQDHTI